jgi:transcriptional regulator with XRE-family HTH domain
MKWYEKIRFARKVSGLSVRDVSKQIGITNGYFNQIENGQIKDPSFFKIAKIMKLFNLSIDDLNNP